MDTIKELKIFFDIEDSIEDKYYVLWYKKAITWILKHIQESEVLSVEWIEIYLKKLLEE